MRRVRVAAAAAAVAVAVTAAVCALVAMAACASFGAADAEGGLGGEATYGDITDPARWSSFDLAGKLDDSLTSFQGAVFDGQNLYLVPDKATDALRFDTVRGSFAPGDWWTFVDSSTHANLWLGGLWDGQRVYFFPNGAAPPNNLVAFSPDAGAFTNVKAWEGYAVGGAQYGAAGGVFDGHYVYLVPHLTTTLTRFPAGDLGGATTFEAVDLVAVGGKQFVGGAFDGRYVYVVPSIAAATEVAVRFDTTAASLTAAGALETFDLIKLGSTPVQTYAGAIFDGRYLYYAPYVTGGVGPASIVARYDTTSPFAQKGSWSTHDLAPAAQFVGGTFDGRYVYFVPNRVATAPGTAVVERYDTTGVFEDPAAWSSFDLATLLGRAGANAGYYGAAFDGRYVYLVPSQGGILVRFDARSPTALPTFAGGGVPAFL